MFTSPSSCITARHWHARRTWRGPGEFISWEGLPAWANLSRLALMIADVRRFLESGPFEPFVIVTSSGSRYRIPSSDHATINPQGSRVVMWFDDESGVIISGLHIAAVEKEAPQKAKAA